MWPQLSHLLRSLRDGPPGSREPAIWLALTASLVWLCAPLWARDDSILAISLVFDGAMTPWFYDFAARAPDLSDPYALLTDFGAPYSRPLRAEFPNTWDAIWMAPAAQALPWPLQWQVVQAILAAAAGLSTAWMARGFGARGWGIALAGVLGGMNLGVWQALSNGRINAAWIAPSLAACAALLHLSAPPGQGAWPSRLAAGAVAAPMMALAATIYPPFPAILLVALSLPLLANLWGSRGQGLLLISAVSLAAAALAREEVSLILENETLKARLARPDAFCGDYSAASLGQNLLLVAPDSGTRPGLQSAGFPASIWVFALGAIFWPARGWKTAWLALCGAGLALLSLGPCAYWGKLSPIEPLAPLYASLEPIWGLLHPLLDYGRLATLGWALLAALAGVVTEQLSSKRRWGRRLIPLLAALLLAHAGWIFLEKTLHPDSWRPLPPTRTAELLAGRAPGLTADLPFDEEHQFFSAIVRPEFPRINPIHRDVALPSNDLLIRWLQVAGHQRHQGDPPPLPELKRSKVRWVVFDPGQCDGQPYCYERLTADLERLLGAPAECRGKVCLWDVSAALEPRGSPP